MPTYGRAASGGGPRSQRIATRDRNALARFNAQHEQRQAARRLAAPQPIRSVEVTPHPAEGTAHHARHQLPD